MKIWEYHVEYSLTEDSMKMLGKKGWELVFVTVSAGNYSTAYFKRELEPIVNSKTV